MTTERRKLIVSRIYRSICLLEDRHTDMLLSTLGVSPDGIGFGFEERTEARATGAEHRTKMSPQDARALAYKLHAGQTDKLGMPYTEHLHWVVEHLLRRWPDALADEICAAWLHDVLRNAVATPASLLADGVPPTVIGIVEAVTQPEGAAYLPWIETLASAGDISVIRVKLADNADNQAPERQHPRWDEMRAGKYLPAAIVLEAALLLIDVP